MTHNSDIYINVGVLTVAKGRNLFILTLISLLQIFVCSLNWFYYSPSLFNERPKVASYASHNNLFAKLLSSLMSLHVHDFVFHPLPFLFIFLEKLKDKEFCCLKGL